MYFHQINVLKFFCSTLGLEARATLVTRALVRNQNQKGSLGPTALRRKALPMTRWTSLLTRTENLGTRKMEAEKELKTTPTNKTRKKRNRTRRENEPSLVVMKTNQKTMKKKKKKKKALINPLNTSQRSELWKLWQARKFCKSSSDLNPLQFWIWK